MEFAKIMSLPKGTPIRLKEEVRYASGIKVPGILVFQKDSDKDSNRELPYGIEYPDGTQCWIFTAKMYEEIPGDELGL